MIGLLPWEEKTRFLTHSTRCNWRGRSLALPDPPAADSNPFCMQRLSRREDFRFDRDTTDQRKTTIISQYSRGNSRPYEAHFIYDAVFPLLQICPALLYMYDKGLSIYFSFGDKQFSDTGMS